MGRTFSLRGLYNTADNALGKQKEIFNYISPDRTRGWKIKEAYFFPATSRAEIGGSDGQYMVQATLWTDQAVPKEFDEVTRVDDNRQCAWSYQQYLIRDGPVSDFLPPAAAAGTLGSFIVDPDTIVVKELYISAAVTSESSTSPTRNWNYIVILEEVRLSPSESVLLQVKGIGQDVDN